MKTPSSTVRLHGRPVPYVIVRSDRARLVRLRIGPDPVVRIIVPARYRPGSIADLLEPNSRWILKQLDRLSHRLETPPPPAAGDRLPFLGHELALEVAPARGRGSVSLIEDRLIVACSEPDLLAPSIKEWYRNQARMHLSARADTFAQPMRVAYGRIAIKDQRSRWGSCSSRGNLNFNWRLMMAPSEVVDYVVIHELAHLRIPNHSRDFWELVESLCPDRKIHQGWLRDHGGRLADMFRLE